jgi:hypothetical protein
MTINLPSMPGLAYARYGRDNSSHKRTIAEMKAALPDGAREFQMFRNTSGRASNAFCHYTMPDGSRVARYHDTDILTVLPNGDVRITFNGWHTLSTRARFNEAASFFGVPLRYFVLGKADVTGFHVFASPGCIAPNSPRFILNDQDAHDHGGPGYHVLTIPAGTLARTRDDQARRVMPALEDEAGDDWPSASTPPDWTL